MNAKKGQINLLHFFIPLTVLFIVGSFYFTHQSIVQVELLVLFGLIYLIMVIIHHHIDKSLTFEMIAEYILIAVLSIIIVSGGLFIL